MMLRLGSCSTGKGRLWMLDWFCMMMMVFFFFFFLPFSFLELVGACLFYRYPGLMIVVVVVVVVVVIIITVDTDQMHLVSCIMESATDCQS